MRRCHADLHAQHQHRSHQPPTEALNQMKAGSENASGHSQTAFKAPMQERSSSSQTWQAARNGRHPARMCDDHGCNRPAMQIIPAIDLLDGHCVRLHQGDYDQVTRFNDDPVAQALDWQRQGAERLHLVDPDGAKTGQPVKDQAVMPITAASMARNRSVSQKPLRL